MESEAIDSRPAVNGSSTDSDEKELDEDLGGDIIKHEVALNISDATPDVFFSGNGSVLSSFSQAPFQHLVSAIRADTGVKAGRYVFEVKVLEQSKTEHLLRLGFSTARSSLFLGDGSSDSVAFDSDGTFISAEPDQERPLRVEKACKAFHSHRVISIVVNLNKDAPNGNTLAVFLDGQRAGPSKPIPAHLHGKVLYPTITFQNATLAVNFGSSGQRFSKLPFRCRALGQPLIAHSERIPSVAGERKVLFPIGLPDEGVYDFVDQFLEASPEYLEISARAMQRWSLSSRQLQGRHAQKETTETAFECSVEVPEIQSLLNLSERLGRNLVVVDSRLNLLKVDRQRFLDTFQGVKKVATVVVGEPTQAFKSWVHAKIRSERESKRRRLSEDSTSASSIDDSVWFLPHSNSDISMRDITSHFSNFSLPELDEGLDEINFAWSQEAEAKAKLQSWIQSKKETVIVENLCPGSWFKQKLEEWKLARASFRQKHVDFSNRVKNDSALLELASSIEVSDVKDVHDIDGKKTPIYANFKYEDWLLLSWRYELHLLAHAFLIDVDDAQRMGIPEDHVSHYFNLYFHASLEPRARLGVDGLTQAVKLMKEPLILEEIRPGRRVLQSKLEKDTPLEAFVSSIEVYRRDRQRRMEAGDESAQLSFPKPAAKAAQKPSAPKAKPPAQAPRPVPKPPTQAPPQSLIDESRGVKRPLTPPAQKVVVKHPPAKAPQAPPKAPIAKRKAVP